MSHSLLLEKTIGLLHQENTHFPVLDLACGSGRNGLYLLERDIPVVFADIKESALEEVKIKVDGHNCDLKALASFWEVDFEQDTIKPLAGKTFSAVMVFRYLHRPLFEQIKQAVTAGGYVIYETFNVDQPQFGRPKNPNFLLKHGELIELFSDWHIVHSFEGIIDTRKSDANNESGKQAITQIIARKPLS